MGDTRELPTEPLPRAPGGRRRPPGARAILIALAVMVAFADSSIVVLALPQLIGAYDSSVEEIAWVVTAYNLVVAVLAIAMVPFARRLAPRRMAVAGLVLFAAACGWCAAAGSTAELVAARSVQGVGGALLLAASLPLLDAATGSQGRGAALWSAAGVVGAAIGPAAGGALTQGFDWRAIFIAQIPLALAALAALPGLRVPPNPYPAGIGQGLRAPTAAGAALALLSAALVGALFLSVVLMIDGWGHEPLLAAGIVSALPGGALVGSFLAGRSEAHVAIGGGAVLLAAGLGAMALLPEASLPMLAGALVLCGLGVGLALPALTGASLRGREPAAAGTWSVGVRHAGLVVGLALLAPLLAADLDGADERAQLAGTSALLEAPLSIDRKIEIGERVAEVLQATPAGQVPDLLPVLQPGEGDDPALFARLRGRLDRVIQATITTAFRNSFALCAALALAALLALAFLRRRELR